MRIVVCVKWVPQLRALAFDPQTRRLVREGVPGEVSAFDVRAVVGAVALRERHGGEVVVLTMGPPAARAGLVEGLALGADRAIHLADPALAGSDTLATARALAAVLVREAPDLVLLGRASVDAETGQVGPELAELLDLPQVTAVRHLRLDDACRTFDVERDTDDGIETVAGALPVVLTVGEDFAPERLPSKTDRQAAATKPVVTVGLADVGLGASAVGAAGSPTWVEGLESADVARRGERLEGGTPEDLARRLGERLRALGALGGSAVEAPALPPPSAGTGPAVWVVVEMAGSRPARVTAELLSKAVALAGPLGAPVEAIVIGAGTEHVARLAAAGADRVLLAEEPSLEPYSTEAHAAVLAVAIREREPRLVLFASTIRGRDLAPRVAARLGLGLTGDAIDVDVDAEGRVRQLKPAFGGAIVAPILSHTRPEMVTVRPGLLAALRPDPTRHAVVEQLAIPAVEPRVRVVSRTPLEDAGAGLDGARLVLGIGRGVGGPEGVAIVRAVATRIGAALAGTRDVVDAGWLPRHLQVGLTGRAIAPRLYVALGVSGAMEHMVGLRRAGTIVAINASAKAPILRAADLAVVADLHALLPYFDAAFAG
ncbi:MAG: FAD-binding protein [Candidatus Binatia bacterium]